MAMPISTGSTPERRAIGMPIGASTRLACGDPIDARTPDTAKNMNGIAIVPAGARVRTASITRSMVPLACAKPKK